MRDRASKLNLAGDSSKPPELVATKLRIPPARPDLVPRERLIGTVTGSLPRKLILVSAPAGFGKTTLVAEWARRSPRSVGWVSLDEGDNDPARFWSYFVAALHGLASQVGADLPLSLLAVGSGPVEGFLASLINEVAALPIELVLVLDDYHLITEKSIHQAMGSLLDHLPPQLQLVIASREDPPLTLSRLRARGQLLELRPNELRFTLEEAAAFLSHTMGLNLSPEDVAALEARTEGWIAGLQLAALSIQGRDDVSAFVEAFTGNQRHVLDYLADEVFNRQPEKTRRFLLLTSILERLSAPLCDTLMEGADSLGVLRRLEDANLFLVPLDEERQWYRYHHLFAEFLRNRLARTYPERIQELQERASEWLEAEGFLQEALEHALAAADHPRAARLIELTAEHVIKRGGMASLARWMRTLPEHYIRPNPRLCLAHAWALAGVGDLQAAEDRLRDAERGLSEGAQWNDVAAGIAVLRGFLATMRGDASEAVTSARQAMEKMSASNSFVPSMVALTYGFAYELMGDAAAAVRAYLEATASGQSVGNVLVTVGALAQMGDLQVNRGQLRYAEHLYRQALQANAGETGWSLFNAAAHIGLGRVLLEWNDLNEAERHIESGVRQMEGWGAIGAVFSAIILAEAKQTRGDTEGAMEAMYRAGQASSAMPSLFEDVMTALEARIWLRRGELEKARIWARQVSWTPQDKVNSMTLYTYSTLGRTLLAEGRLDEAVTMLSSLIETAEATGYWGLVVDSLAVLALAHDAQGEGVTALATLRRALALAEPEGYVRTFAQEDAPMFSLLSRLLAELESDGDPGNAAPSRGYVERLLAAFPTSHQLSVITDQRPASRTQNPEFSTRRSPQSALPQPLSGRELELLRLAADGMSTHEIADQLVIAEGTVKRHLHNIYGKLGAASRTQAIAAARRLGLLRD